MRRRMSDNVDYVFDEPYLILLRLCPRFLKCFRSINIDTTSVLSVRNKNRLNLPTLITFVFVTPVLLKMPFLFIYFFLAFNQCVHVICTESWFMRLYWFLRKCRCCSFFYKFYYARSFNLYEILILWLYRIKKKTVSEASFCYGLNTRCSVISYKFSRYLLWTTSLCNASFLRDTK